MFIRPYGSNNGFDEGTLQRITHHRASIQNTRFLARTAGFGKMVRLEKI